MAGWCISNLEPEVLDKVAKYYEFKTSVENQLPLLHPHISGENLFSADYAEASNRFCRAIIDGGAAKGNAISLFYSSPCAVAYVNKATCYTEVGREDRAMRLHLCHGIADSGLVGECNNMACLYNSKRA
jgi:hypothetical protein